MTLLSKHDDGFVGQQAQCIPVSVIMRLLQAFGSSAVLAIGAGTLADIYEKHERGSK